jgi:hypothetical protein
MITALVVVVAFLFYRLITVDVRLSRLEKLLEDRT